MTTLADRIRRRRHDLGLSMAQAARRASMSRQQWQEIEGGANTDIRLSTLSRIADALGVEPVDLLQRVPAPRSSPKQSSAGKR